MPGAQVFVPEQVLYTRGELDRHVHIGDVEGPLAESSFQGHPMCRFCKRRFFGENELFNHMHQQHEQCFLCKRANPNKFVYYRDYPELEGGPLFGQLTDIGSERNMADGILTDACRALQTGALPVRPRSVPPEQICRVSFRAGAAIDHLRLA